MDSPPSKHVEAYEELQSLEMKHPEGYEDFATFFDRNRSVGYKNLCRMLMGEYEPRVER